MNEDLVWVGRTRRALEAVWRTGLLPRPVLDEPSLVKVAAPAAEDREWLYRDRDWLEPFRRLLADLDGAKLNPVGEVMAHGQLVMVLKARIRAARLWARHPEILERPVRAPIIVLGQMRSGTTRVQRLLACDPFLGFTRLHESLMPVPFGPPGRSDPRRRRAALGLAFLRRLNPETARIHPTWTDAPEEEFGLFSFSFGSAQFEAQWRIPAFVRFWEESDKSRLYQEFHALLQTVSWHQKAPLDRPWILKAPQFLQDLPALLGLYPDARLLCLERDPGAIVPSSASLVWNQMRVQSDAADPRWIGAEWLRKTRLREQIKAAALKNHPEVARMSLGFDEMNGDWRSAMRRVYDFLGLTLTPDVEARMTAFLRRSRSHLGHRYEPGFFGLTAEDLTQLTNHEDRP